MGPGALLSWARDELQRRLQSGEPCRAETFLSDYPTLASDPDQALDLVFAEFLTRRALGQSLDPDEWYSRFPQWRDRLQRQFADLPDPGQVGAQAPPTRPDQGAPTATPAPLTPRAPFDPGGAGGDAPLGRHEVFEELGRGGMGVVYRAYDAALGRFVALKMIRSGALEGPEVERFQREARAAARLRHPNILPIYSVGFHDGRPCFTMPLIQGGVLAGRLERYQQDARAAAALMEKVARAVHAAHQAGVVHRDLKPGNILIDEQGEPLVADFGLAKLLDAEADATVSGQRVGTPAYMSPEQASGRSRLIGPASDVWSLGVILYELLAGRRPFEGEDVVHQILVKEPPPLARVRPGTPRDLAAPALKCLRKEPGLRYASAEELADDLRRWLDGQPRSAEPWRRRLGRLVRRPWVGAAAGLLALLVVLTAFLPRGAAPAEPPPLRSVALIGAEGLPDQGRWALGDGSLKEDADGVVRVESEGLGLVEVLAPPCDRYRFRAEMQAVGDPGAIGLALLLRRQRTVHGDEFWFLEATFSERAETLPLGSRSKQAAAVVSVRRVVVGAAKINSLSRDAAPAVYFPARRREWRRLAVEVKPDVVNVYWAGQPVPVASIARTPTVKRYVDRLAADAALPNPSPPALSPRGGLGFVCSGGAALVRRAFFEPLAPDE
jgi:hypothetical protein